MALSRVADVPSHVLAPAAALRAPLPVAHVVHHHAHSQHVRMVLAVPHATSSADVCQQYDTLEVMPEEAIKVRLRACPCYA